jgi:hypothetical protein
MAQKKYCQDHSGWIGDEFPDEREKLIKQFKRKNIVSHDFSYILRPGVIDMFRKHNQVEEIIVNYVTSHSFRLLVKIMPLLSKPVRLKLSSSEDIILRNSTCDRYLIPILTQYNIVDLKIYNIGISAESIIKILLNAKTLKEYGWVSRYQEKFDDIKLTAEDRGIALHIYFC